jgi:glycosyltransferase involved in cell wall biosynthesis
VSVRPEISVIAPVYNEVDNVEPLVDELIRTLATMGRPYEIVLVDDGSTDGSAEAIARKARERPQVRGQTAAFDAGIKEARGDVVVTIDADLQNDPADIPRLVAALDGHDAAIGYRKVREDALVRRASSRIANAVRNRLSGDDVIDTGCSLKAFRASRLRDVKLFSGMHRFLPTLIKIEGGSVVQLPATVLAGPGRASTACGTGSSGRSRTCSPCAG